MNIKMIRMFIVFFVMGFLLVKSGYLIDKKEYLEAICYLLMGNILIQPLTRAFINPNEDE